jgi:hypothetical protein
MDAGPERKKCIFFSYAILMMCADMKKQKIALKLSSQSEIRLKRRVRRKKILY